MKAPCQRTQSDFEFAMELELHRVWEAAQSAKPDHAPDPGDMALARSILIGSAYAGNRLEIMRGLIQRIKNAHQLGERIAVTMGR